MSNPFNAITDSLSGILNAMSNAGAQIVPVFEDQPEELFHPDAEAEQERKNLRDTDEAVGGFAETNRDYLSRSNIEIPSERSIARTRETFRYFIDGSARTAFVGQIIEGDRLLPFHISQGGAASLVRDSVGAVSEYRSEIEMNLLVAQNMLSDTLRSYLGKLQLSGIGLLDSLREGEEISNFDTLRQRGASRARRKMKELEEKLIKEVSEEVGEEQWIVVDGSLMDLRGIEALKNCIGLSKSFTLEPMIYLQNRQRVRINFVRELLYLPEGHRTRAFYIYDGQYICWYLRLRARGVASRLKGIIKVEIRKDHKDSALYDALSSLLVTERNPTPYHTRRWHAHLYPIYLAEEYLKSSFLSMETLRGIWESAFSRLMI